MKKRFYLYVLLCFSLFIISACSSSPDKPSINYLSIYPNKLNDYADITKPIQLLYENNHEAYLLVTSNNSTRAFVSLNTEKTDLTIHLHSDSNSTAQQTLQVFKLSTPQIPETLHIERDGKATYFNSIIYTD